MRVSPFQPGLAKVEMPNIPRLTDIVEAMELICNEMARVTLEAFETYLLNPRFYE
jgi:hypothetical protein